MEHANAALAAMKNKEENEANEGFLEKNHMTIEGQVLRFLIEVNKRLEGIHIEETSDMHSTLIKFEATLTCPYANPPYWSPNHLFHTVIADLLRKYLGIHDEGKLGYNNTKTVFWISLDDIQSFVVESNCAHMKDKNEK